VRGAKATTPQFWTAYATPSPLNGDVHAIAWDAAHLRLFVGGNFTNAGGNPNADFLAVWDGSNWAPSGEPRRGAVDGAGILQVQPDAQPRRARQRQGHGRLHSDRGQCKKPIHGGGAEEASVTVAPLIRAGPDLRSVPARM